MKRNNLIIATFVNIAFVLLAILLFDAHYEVNDDFGMAAIASGMYGFSSPYIVFSNIIYGNVLVWLYRALPAINWIVVLYYVMLVIVGTMILDIVLECKKRMAKYCYVISIFVLYREIYCVITFTRIAGYVAISAYVVLIYCLHEKEHYSKGKCLFAGIALVYSSMLRFDSFLEVSAYAFVFWIIQLVSKKFFSISKMFIVYLTIFGAILALLVVNKLAYSSEEWQEYNHWNKVRSELLDYSIPRYFKYENEYKQLGITYAEYDSLIHWCIEDPDVYSADVYSDIRKIDRNQRIHIKKVIKKMLCVVLEYYYLWIPLIFGCLVAFWSRNKKIMIINCALFFVFFAELCYLIIKGRYVARVLVGLGASYYLFVLAGILIFETNDGRQSIVKDICTGGVFAIVSMAAIIPCYKVGNSFKQGDLAVLDYIKSESENNLIVLEAYAHEYVMRAHGLMKAPQKGLCYDCLNLGGWYTQAPPMQKKQKTMGVENTYMKLIDDNVIYISYSTEDVCAYYLREKTGKEIDYQLVMDLGEIRAYRYYEE